jgi:PAS domain S-box-containing protein
MSETDQSATDLRRAIDELHLHLAAGDPRRDQLLERAIIASCSGITIADARLPDMPLIYTNPAFTRITGYSAAEVLGRNCRFLHRDETNQPGLDEVRRAIREQREGVAILRNYRRDGSLLWNELYLSPVHDDNGNLTHFIGIQNDVTARVQLDEAREFFLQVASHDLKSPLHAIQLAARTFSTVAPVGSTVSERLHDVLETIVKRSSEMQGIIDDYLDLQTLDAGQVKMASEPLDLDRLCQKVLESNADYASGKKIELRQERPSKPPPVKGDEKKITQVAQNLISNAIKFSPSGSRVTIRIRQDGRCVRVEVSDEGPGLTKDDLQKVFGKFSRLSNKPTGGEKSSGLGLHICQRLMEMQGGEIGVFNNPDRGATFWCSLPQV